MIWLTQKGWNILTSGFSLSSTAQPVTVLEALYVLSGKRTKLHDQAFRLLVYSLSYFIVAGFLLERGTVPQLKYVIFHLFTCFFTIYGCITNSQRDQRALDLVDLLESSWSSWASTLTYSHEATWRNFGIKQGTIGCKMLGLVEPP